MSAIDTTACVRVGFRVTKGERAALTALVQAQRDAVAAHGLGAVVNEANVLRALVRQEAARMGIAIDGTPSPVASGPRSRRRTERG